MEIPKRAENMRRLHNRMVQRAHMSRKERLFIIVISTAIAIAVTIALVINKPSQQHGCALTQPVYAGTALVGEWHVTLRYGQFVTLPDGDTATCTARELVIS
jgi:hypothetical protein